MAGFSIPIPKSWHKRVRSAVIDIISLAHWSIVYTRSMCANSSLAKVRLAGQADRLKNEVALLKAEIRIKDARFSRVPAKNRPHYSSEERMSILEFRAARGLNKAQTARTFLIEPETVTAWLKRLDE